jgi:tRNA(His) 5'-end guanylyltransferase
MRLDGKAFHTVTKNCIKPFDGNLKQCFITTAQWLLTQIQGAKFAYHQSDELSILITDYDTLSTEAGFDYNVQKMTSVSAALCSVKFSEVFEYPCYFDSRVFNIPKEEVLNYFIWRQKDWERNSIQMLCRSHFSHKDLINKSTSQMHEMLHDIGVNWACLDEQWKNGSIVTHDSSVHITASLTKDIVREYFNTNYVYKGEL